MDDYNMNRRSFLKIFFGSIATAVAAPIIIAAAPKTIIISRTGISPDKIIQGQAILVPTFEIASNPIISLSEVKARRFYIVDRAQTKAKEAIQKEEDKKFFNLINTAVRGAV
jgi:hypothetical protein